jgi:hypothetical protein
MYCLDELDRMEALSETTWGSYRYSRTYPLQPPTPIHPASQQASQLFKYTNWIINLRSECVPLALKSYNLLYSPDACYPLSRRGDKKGPGLDFFSVDSQ